MIVVVSIFDCTIIIADGPRDLVHLVSIEFRLLLDLRSNSFSLR